MALNIFNIGTDVEKEEVKDTLGNGKSFVWDTGVYDAKITKAYIDRSQGGAYNINLTLETEDGRKLDITEYVTNRDGLNYYIDKKTGKKKLLPGMNKMNALAETLTGKSLQDLETEEKMVEVYDRELGKRVPKPRQVIMDLLNQEGKFGIIKVKDFGDKEQTPDKIKEKNELDKVFNKDGFTLTELKAGKETPEFIKEYKKKYTSDFIKDKTTSKSSNKPVANKPKKSLFN